MFTRTLLVLYYPQQPVLGERYDTVLFPCDGATTESHLGISLQTETQKYTTNT